MSKRKWTDFKAQIAKRRQGGGDKAKPKGSGNGETVEYLTVQRLSEHVEGKCQKYRRLGPLTMVEFNGEMSLDSIKAACQKHFDIPSSYKCDIMAGDRGPSFSSIEQIKSFKLLHIRFVESSQTDMNPIHEHNRNMPSSSGISTNKPVCTNILSVTPSASVSRPQAFPASISLASMLNIGKLIPPAPLEKESIIISLEEFFINGQQWSDAKTVKLNVWKKPFANGGFREAFKAECTHGLDTKRTYVVKKYKTDQEASIINLFGSIEDHTRKSVQMNSLAQHLTSRMAFDCPRQYGPHFAYNTVYFAKSGDTCFTVENYISGNFVKYINNTGSIVVQDQSDQALKSESLAHYSYCKSNKQLMILDIQGAGYQLYDPEIASTKLSDDEGIYFCLGNLSETAINNFFERHTCNEFCKMMKLSEASCIQ